MLAKSWKKIGLIILIIACLWNIVSKLVYKVSFDDVVTSVKNNFNKEETTQQQTIE